MANSSKLPEAIRLVVYAHKDKVVYDRLFIDAPTIPQLREIRSVTKAVLATIRESEDDG